MAKKSLKDINTAEAETGVDSGAVYDNIEHGQKKRKENTAAGKEERQERQATLRTQGRKGCRQKRINIILTPDNHQFVSVMGALTGRNRTQFINYVLDEYKKEHADTYKQAQQLIKDLNIEIEQEED